MTVEWLQDASAFADPTWSELVSRDPEASLFHQPRFLKPYWEEFAPPLHLALVRAAGEPVGACAFEISRGTAAFLGGFDITDYLGPVGPPASRETVAKELVEGLAAREGWERADLRGLPLEGSWLPALTAAAEAAGMDVEPGSDDAAPWLDLPASFEEYLSGLAGKQRHEIRRKRRKLRAAAGEPRLIVASAETLVDDLGLFSSWHRSSRGAKGRFMRPAMELFFRRLASALSVDTFRLTFLEAGGERLAAAIGFQDGGVFRLYNSAYDHARGDLAPGMVLIGELIADAIDRGCTGFDMLKGDISYKYRFGARHRGIGRLVLRRAAR